ncbi:MAG: MaoC family dehydratase [Candidatus Omnitrophica bacterium]|nr:MaoC family dehydratase [Candidatus Omnitrophota bacterium]
MDKEALYKKGMTLSTFDISDIEEGMSVSYITRVRKKDVKAFAELSGDVSPLHVNEDFGKKTPFGGNIAHGLLTASYFSTIVGVLLPGRNALLSGIDLDFIRPVPVDSEVTVSASVVKVQRPNRMVVLKLLAFLEGEICLEGAARVKVMAYQQ